MNTSKTPYSELSYGALVPPKFIQGLLWISRNTFLGKGKWRDGIYALIKAIHDKPVDTIMWGIPIRIDPRSNPLERNALLRFDNVDRRDREIMRSYLQDPGAVFVDLGANMGLYTFDATINCPGETHAVAVEANPVMAQRLAFNIESMRRTKAANAENITLFSVAVGEKPGVAAMAVDGPEHLATLFHASGNTIEVPVRPLIELLVDAEIKKIDYLKIDVEGYEGEALGPFLENAPDELLPRCIQIEHNASEEWSRDIFGLMTNRGYREFHRIGMNAFWDRAKSN